MDKITIMNYVLVRISCCRVFFYTVISWYTYTLIRFVTTSIKFGTCTVVSINGTLLEDKMRRFQGECAHFGFNKCLIYTHHSASAKFNIDSHETDNSVCTSDWQYFLFAVQYVKNV
jgi:hypothetical protein